MKIIITVLDGGGTPREITVEVPDNATPEEIEKAIEAAKRLA